MGQAPPRGGTACAAWAPGGHRWGGRGVPPRVTGVTSDTGGCQAGEDWEEDGSKPTSEEGGGLLTWTVLYSGWGLTGGSPRPGWLSRHTMILARAEQAGADTLQE